VTRTVGYRYVTPGVLYLAQDGAYYSLYLQKQPGAAEIPVQVRIVPPPDYQVRSIDVNGQSVDGNQATVRLDADVLLTATLVKGQAKTGR
jgi:hypothetical protein